MSTRDDYEETVEALNRGAELPDVRRPDYRPPSASVLIVAAMLGMFVIVNASAAWETFHDIAPLVSVAYFLALSRWADRP
jgi:hypothetical protein